MKTPIFTLTLNQKLLCATQKQTATSLFVLHGTRGKPNSCLLAQPDYVQGLLPGIMFTKFTILF